MPVYRFQCPKCERQRLVCLSISQRDEHRALCSLCRTDEAEPLTRMVRVPTAGNFTVTGFNAANGYSGKR